LRDPQSHLGETLDKEAGDLPQERVAPTQEGSNINRKSIFNLFINIWQFMPTIWLQERGNGAKNKAGMTLEGPLVVRPLQSLRLQDLGLGLGVELRGSRVEV